MTEHVVRGNLHLDGEDLGEVIAAFATSELSSGVMMTLRSATAWSLPIEEWVMAWVSAVGGEPSVGVRLRRPVSGPIEFVVFDPDAWPPASR